MESTSCRRPKVVMMAEEFKRESTSVSTLDMDSESRRLFNVRKVQKGKKPQFKRTCQSQVQETRH